MNNSYNQKSDSKIGDYEFAALAPDELNQLKELEERLGVTLIAYDQEKEKM